MGCGCKTKAYRTGNLGGQFMPTIAPPSTHLSAKLPDLQAGPKSDECGCNGTNGSTLIHSQAAFPWPVALVGGAMLGWILRGSL